MRTSPSKRWKSGFVSYVVVISTGVVLTLLTVYAYQRAVLSRDVQAKVQLRADYAEKEEAILRSIVAITPNRAMRTMRWDANSSTANANTLRWENIFTESLALANAGTSIASNIVTSLNIANLRVSNSGDSGNLTTPATIFRQTTQANGTTPAGLISSGVNRTTGNALPAGYPTTLLTNTSTETNTSTRDLIYPLISNNKRYDLTASASQFRQLRYPNINFGYARPGDNFVAKRNWWSFSMDVANQDVNLTRLAISRRDFILSIFEIPSQLAISASSFMTLGKYTGGAAWENYTIAGPIFAGRAELDGISNLSSLSSRRGMTFTGGATVGGLSGTAFAPGTREATLMTQGAFYPVSLASESGRAAFVPINRGAEFFDRFHPENLRNEANALSTTTWNNYSVGAMQAAMQLDITGVTSSTNRTPTMLRFSYLLASGARASMNVPLTGAFQTTMPLPPGYVKVADENQSFTFSSTVPVDVAYGKPGGYVFRNGVTGAITFNNATFGDPLVGTGKEGYWRPQNPLVMKNMPSGQICVAVNPQRLPAFLATLGAATTATNNSIVVNVDYSNTGINNNAFRPNIPCTANDYGVILQECADLTSFTTGFSLVTNLRLYIGDDFNVVATTPPTGFTPAGLFYPPCSLFTPEKRYGVEQDAFRVELEGQVGSLAAVDRVNTSDAAVTSIRPLDSKNRTGNAIAADRIAVNLRPITHPAELPPITMMNWLILLEERRKEFY